MKIWINAYTRGKYKRDYVKGHWKYVDAFIHGFKHGVDKGNEQ